MWLHLLPIDPPVQAKLAHDAQNVHLPSGLQLLAADVGGDEATCPADPCTGSNQREVGEVTGDQGMGETGEHGRLGLGFK